MWEGILETTCAFSKLVLNDDAMCSKPHGPSPTTDNAVPCLMCLDLENSIHVCSKCH